MDEIWISDCSISEQFEESELDLYKCDTILHHKYHIGWTDQGGCDNFYVFSKEKTQKHWKFSNGTVFCFTEVSGPHLDSIGIANLTERDLEAPYLLNG